MIKRMFLSEEGKNMEEKFFKVYRILKYVMLLIFLISALLIFLPSNYVPFDISTFRRNYGLVLFLVMLVSFASFIYFLIYPALERFKANMKKSLFEDTKNRFDEVDKQIEELKKQMETKEDKRDG